MGVIFLTRGRCISVVKKILYYINNLKFLGILQGAMRYIKYCSQNRQMQYISLPTALTLLYNYSIFIALVTIKIPKKNKKVAKCKEHFMI